MFWRGLGACWSLLSELPDMDRLSVAVLVMLFVSVPVTVIAYVPDGVPESEVAGSLDDEPQAASPMAIAKISAAHCMNFDALRRAGNRAKSSSAAASSSAAEFAPLAGHPPSRPLTRSNGSLPTAGGITELPVDAAVVATVTENCWPTVISEGGVQVPSDGAPEHESEIEPAKLLAEKSSSVNVAVEPEATV